MLQNSSSGTLLGSNQFQNAPNGRPLSTESLFEEESGPEEETHGNSSLLVDGRQTPTSSNTAPKRKTEENGALDDGQKKMARIQAESKESVEQAKKTNMANNDNKNGTFCINTITLDFLIRNWFATN